MKENINIEELRKLGISFNEVIENLLEASKALRKEPEYSHLIGKWVRCDEWSKDSYCHVTKIEGDKIYFDQEIHRLNPGYKESTTYWSLFPSIQEVPFSEIAPYIIKEAEKRYPEGTRFRSAFNDMIGSSTGKFELEYDGRRVYSDGFTVYYKNQWGEIISKPEEIEEGYYLISFEGLDKQTLAEYKNSNWFMIGVSEPVSDSAVKIIRRVEV